MTEETKYIVKPRVFLGKVWEYAWGALRPVTKVAMAAFASLTTVMVFAETGMLGWAGVQTAHPYSLWEVVYLCAATTLTIGSGDVSPHTWIGQAASLLLGGLGLLCMGIIVTLCIWALEGAQEPVEPTSGGAQGNPNNTGTSGGASCADALGGETPQSYTIKTESSLKSFIYSKIT